MGCPSFLQYLTDAILLEPNTYHMCQKRLAKICCRGEMVPKRHAALVDGDAASLGLPGLGNNEAQDTVVEVSHHSILIDAAREAESAREFANGSLRDPKLLEGSLVLLDMATGALGHLSTVALFLHLLSLLVLDRCLVGVVILVLVGDGGGQSSRRVVALDPATDHDSLRIRKLNVDVLAVDARELSVKLEGGFRLAYIEAGVESAHGLALAAMAVVVRVLVDLATVVVKVVEHAEEAAEARVGAVKTAVQRHLRWCG